MVVFLLLSTYLNMGWVSDVSSGRFDLVGLGRLDVCLLSLYLRNNKIQRFKSHQTIRFNDTVIDRLFTEYWVS